MINLVTPNIETKQSTDPGWSATRYGWSPGQDIDVKDYQCGHRVIRQGELVKFDDYTYRTRNQDISNGAEEYADVKNTAFEIEHTLSQAYGERGLIFFTALEGADGEYAEKILNALLDPELPVETAFEEREAIPLRILKPYFERGRARAYLEKQPLTPSEARDAEAVGNQMMTAIQQSVAYQNAELDTREREVQEARAGRGGVSHFDPVHKHFYTQLGRRMPAENDNQRLEETAKAIGQAVAGASKPANDNGDVLAAVLSVVKQQGEMLQAMREELKQKDEKKGKANKAATEREAA